MTYEEDRERALDAYLGSAMWTNPELAAERFLTHYDTTHIEGCWWDIEDEGMTWDAHDFDLDYGPCVNCHELPSPPLSVGAS